jgi:hypothetical protein
MYSFDADGLLDIRSAAEGVSMQLSRFRGPEQNVIDLQPKIMN